MGVALVDDNARRCALPGCNEVIEDIPGRPPRRYCTAAHRAAARQARRAAAQAGQDARLAATLPWLLDPLEDPEAAPVPHGVREQRAIVEARRVQRASQAAAGRGRPRTTGRRRRTMAVFGAAGILAASYAFTASEPIAPTR